jgi:hypothetical protein
MKSRILKICSISIIAVWYAIIFFLASSGRDEVFSSWWFSNQAVDVFHSISAIILVIAFYLELRNSGGIIAIKGPINISLTIFSIAVLTGSTVISYV